MMMNRYVDCARFSNIFDIAENINNMVNKRNIISTLLSFVDYEKNFEIFVNM